MAFTLQVIRGSTTYTISHPYYLEGAEGMGGASIRNIEEGGPFQDGLTHLDERLDPRTITLKLNVVGASASTLDGYRDTLMTIFKPVRGVPITLKITRDDGSVRQINTRRTGPLDIPLLAINRPGNLHRAVVQLRAADPRWYDPTEISVPFLGASDWWLAYNTIGTADVLEHVESPGTAQLWANSGSVVSGSPWTIFFRSGTATGNPLGDSYAFGQNASGTSAIYFIANTLGFFQTSIDVAGAMSVAAMAAGTAGYFLTTNGGTSTVYANGTVLATRAGVSMPIEAASAPGTARWRSPDNVGGGTSNIWTIALPHAAIYNIALTSTQRSALDAAARVGGSAYNVAVVYTGDIDSYPTITITGPITNPVITNTTTGDTLDFTGGTVGSADAWTIDTRYGRKSVVNTAGSSVENYLSLDSDLATFRLAPDPIATGGTNVISVAGTATGTATLVTLAYYNRYLSY